MLRKAVNLVPLAHYVLMNKNTPVLSFDYDLGDHKAVRIREVFAPEAAPFGFVDRRGDISKAELNYWWRHRAIPASRAHVKRLLENLQLESTLVLAEKSFGLSLSDRYWLNDEDDPASWDAVNFFDNDFSDDLGFLTLGQDLAGSSPDAPDYRTGEPVILERETLGEAVNTAYDMARPGDVVLLSPASASFDQFKNFEERGNVFKQFVNQL